MKTFSHVLAVGVLAFAPLINAHLKLSRPVPYGISTLNRSPLVNANPWKPDTQSDYPCKQRPGVYDIVQMNHMPVGEPQELSFLGTVSHGGGTCQLAITKDQKPDAWSTFKVFQVFEGGCPVNSNGNTPTHPFTFVLPKGMPNGVMTFAWVWYNRMGDREIYMNCAPVNITGGSDDDGYFNSLPNVYLINLPAQKSSCQSTSDEQSNAVIIPHPGQYILSQPEGQDMHVATGHNCSAAAAAQLAGVVGYQSSVITNNGAAYSYTGTVTAVPVGSSGAASLHHLGPTSSGAGADSISPVPTSSPAGSAAPSSGNAESMGTSSPAPTSGTSTPAGSPILTLPPGTAAPTGTGGLSSSAAASTGSTNGAACDRDDIAIKCSADGKQFGVCDNGKMVWRPVAPGTICKNGLISKRDDYRNPHVRRLS